MSMDALDAVMKAEELADARLSNAAAEARKLMAEAEADGRQMIRTAEAEAEETVEERMAEYEKKAAEAAREVLIVTSDECQAIRSAALSRMPEAVRMVVERIVND